MAGKNQVVGQAKIKVDGAPLDTDGQSTLEIGGPKREPVPGDYQAGAFRQTTEPSKLEVSILVKPGTALSAIRDLVDATLTIEFDTGQAWIIRNAYSADVPSITTSDGKAKLVFQGEPAEAV